ncbi:von Willebrand factor A domain-containing protein 5B1 isoform X4 [Mobula birostris]|uniref:von Willebrand factor A domain-containing protein 5B1 isoform X4 n=1 Tax=Mobula birostris TaxID=1983395 RepID=UPI003B281321
MPGLLNQSTWTPLPLNASSIRACTNGFSLRISTSLTYTNPENVPVEGVFVYLLDESEVVADFEALTAGRLVTTQVKNRARAEDCCFECYSCSNLALQCSKGHLILDEDMDRTTFIVSTGLIGSLETMAIFLTTTMELQTQQDGTVQVLFPPVFMPLVRKNEGKVASTRSAGERFSSTNCFGAGGIRVEKSNKHRSLPEILTGQVFNPVPYEFSFEMLVRGPCLLAGVESPTHALRAGADPIARSASTLYITLAEKHQYDRNLQIILHPCEPHVPHLLLEKGSLSFEEYEQHIKNRRDFTRVLKKNSNTDKKVDFVRKRFHKDIRFNPVLMLNFCPDLHSIATDFGSVTREIIFLIDRSGDRSGVKMGKIKEAMIVAIKSLPPGTLLNIIGLGSNVRTLFSSSRLCSDETLSLACEYIQRMGADMGSTNILAALSWIYKQPVLCGYPRQLFLLTDASVCHAGKIIELVRKYATSARCFSYGLGPNACKRLLHRIAKITGGTFESFSEGEQLKPKLIKSLKKAIEPVLSDITIEWYLPDTLEVLLTPIEIGPLYPGDHLNSYGVIYDLSGFQKKKNVVPEGSSTSILTDRMTFEKNDIEEALKEISTEFSGVNAEENEKCKDSETDSINDLRKRMSLASYIHEQYTLTHCSISNLKGNRDRSMSTCGSNSSDSTEPPDISREIASFPHGLENIAHQGQKSLVHWESSNKSLSNFEPLNSKGFFGIDPASDEARRKTKLIAQAALSGRSFSSPNGQLDMHYLRKALEKVSTAKSHNWSIGGRMNDIDHVSQQFQADSSSRKSISDSNTLLFQAGTPEWDSFFDPENLFLPVTLDESGSTEVNGTHTMQCKSVIHGLIGGKSVTWEATANLSSLYHASAEQEASCTSKNPWEGILHQLTVHSVIRDFENMAEKTSDIEYGPSGKYCLKAIQTSRASNSMSIYTTVVPVNAATQESLSSYVKVRSKGVRVNQARGSYSGSKRQRSYSASLVRTPPGHDSAELDDTFGSTGMDKIPTTPTSVGSSSSSGWERQSVPDGNGQSPSIASVRTQKSYDSFFASRFNLGRYRSLSQTGKYIPVTPNCLSAKLDTSPEEEINDYMPLVRLQLACGAFLLNEAFSDAVQIPLDRLRRASPFSCHRASLSPSSRCKAENLLKGKISVHNKSGQCVLKNNQGNTEEIIKVSNKITRSRLEGVSDHGSSPASRSNLFSASTDGHSTNIQLVDSGRGSETENSPVPSESSGASYRLISELSTQYDDLEGMSWATAVGLGWLEHQCAGYFPEWELIAAKADTWLCSQQLPEQLHVNGLKAATRQLFLLLRHWNENIKLNMLCYNPNNM